MKARTIKTATLTISAGQIVELDERQFELARKLGLVEEVKESKKKGAAK